MGCLVGLVSGACLSGEEKCGGSSGGSTGGVVGWLLCRTRQLGLNVEPQLPGAKRVIRVCVCAPLAGFDRQLRAYRHVFEIGHCVVPLWPCGHCLLRRSAALPPVTLPCRQMHFFVVLGTAMLSCCYALPFGVQMQVHLCRLRILGPCRQGCARSHTASFSPKNKNNGSTRRTS